MFHNSPSAAAARSGARGDGTPASPTLHATPQRRRRGLGAAGRQVACRGRRDDAMADQFNREMDQQYESVRDFIIAHYKVSTRDDTPTSLE